HGEHVAVRGATAVQLDPLLSYSGKERYTLALYDVIITNLDGARTASAMGLQLEWLQLGCNILASRRRVDAKFNTSRNTIIYAACRALQNMLSLLCAFSSSGKAGISLNLTR
ncbi:MAG: hypothetical protein LUP95_01610, partial [Euryarchaeota archaeon]|nr:hypothetical protein [Euryarchaeota archaeon]